MIRLLNRKYAFTADQSWFGFDFLVTWIEYIAKNRANGRSIIYYTMKRWGKEKNFEAVINRASIESYLVGKYIIPRNGMQWLGRIYPETRTAQVTPFINPSWKLTLHSLRGMFLLVVSSKFVSLASLKIQTIFESALLNKPFNWMLNYLQH